MIKRIMILGAAFATAANAQTERLIKVYEMPSGTTFLDMNTVQDVGTSKRFWEVEKLTVPDKYRVVLKRTYSEIDCNARMRTQRAYVDYDAQGTVVASDSSLDKPAQWRPIVPGSNGDLIRFLICKR